MCKNAGLSYWRSLMRNKYDHKITKKKREIVLIHPNVVLSMNHNPSNWILLCNNSDQGLFLKQQIYFDKRHLTNNSAAPYKGEEKDRTNHLPVSGNIC